MSTVTVTYILTPRAAVSAGRGPQVGNTRAVYEVIPGTVVRGALAASWFGSAVGRFGGADPQGTFDALFGEAMTVHSAIPSLGGHKPVLVPMSAARCKYPRSGDCYTTWQDLVGDPDLHVCPGCGGKLAYGRGWEMPGSAKRDPWVVSQTRTELERGVAKTDALFTRQALRPTLTLTGTLVIEVPDDDDTSKRVDAGIAWLRAGRHVSIGGQRSVFGRCTWEAKDALPAPGATPAPGSDVAVRLAAPAILLDEVGAPSLDLRHAVETLLGSAGIKKTVIGRHGWTRPLVVGGWHGYAGLPKPEEWALHPGSMVIVKDADEAVVTALAAGVGVRRSEGFGAVDLVAVDAAQAELERRLGAAGHRDLGGQPTAGALVPTSHEGMPPAAQAPAPSPSMPSASVTPTGDSLTGGSPTGDDVEPVPAETARAEPADPVTSFLEGLTEAQRSSVVKGLLAQARHIQRQRANHVPESLIFGALAAMKGYRWMRELGGSEQEAVEDILRAPEATLTAHLVILESWQGGSR